MLCYSQAENKHVLNAVYCLFQLQYSQSHTTQPALSHKKAKKSVRLNKDVCGVIASFLPYSQDITTGLFALNNRYSKCVSMTNRTLKKTAGVEDDISSACQDITQSDVASEADRSTTEEAVLSLAARP